ncbi:MAG: hypothetical protein AAGM21_09255 [Pseudomonadota bacterium]
MASHLNNQSQAGSGTTFEVPDGLVDALSAVSLVLPAIALVFVFLQFRQQRILALEQNLDILQRLNEIALESPENLKAAVTSVAPDAAYDEEESRKIFFHYLRINRLYRAWILRRNFVLRDRDYRDIMDNYAGTLRGILPYWDSLQKRGYSEKFFKDLRKEVEKANVVGKFAKISDSSGSNS